MIAANPLQRLSERSCSVFVQALYPELEGGNRRSIKRLGQTLGKLSRNILRRNEIDLAMGHHTPLIASRAVPEPFIAQWHDPAMRNILLLPFALFAFSAGSAARADEPATTIARIGQRVSVDGPMVTPIRVLEDSRCPMEARCAWAGQVRLLVRIGMGRNRTMREITSNLPINIADGALELVSVMPPQSTRRTLRTRDYRFAFRFSGGI